MTEQIFVEGEAGQIEIFQDVPSEIKAIAIVTHPHPLMGGNPQHKVPKLISDILVEKGCLVWRPSFRGMGQSAGKHDDGNGESADILQLSRELQSRYPDLPFYAGGFSFGSYVWTKTYNMMAENERPKQLVLAGLPCGTVRGIVDYVTPTIDGDIFLVHGEQDEVTALSDLIQWATPQRHPITILPSANHFFTGYLKPLRILLEKYYDIDK